MGGLSVPRGRGFVKIALLAAILLARPARADDCIYVGGESGVNVIDAQTRTVVGMMAVPGGLGIRGTIAIDEAGLYGYFARHGAILGADLQTNTITRSIPLPCGVPDPKQLLLSPDGSRLYGVELGNTLLLIDLISGSVSTPPVEIVDNITNYPAGLFPLSVSMRTDGRAALTLGPNDTYCGVNTADHTDVACTAISGCMRIDDVDNNCGTAYVLVGPVGNFVWAVNAIDQSIAVDGTVLQRLGDDFKYATTYPHPVFLAFSPDGRTEAIMHSELDRVSDPNFIWVETPTSAGPQKVWFSDHSAPVYSDHALAIADVPSGCPGGPIPCPGDCDGSGKVTVDELMTGVRIALGEQSYVDCLAVDADHNGQVTVDELTAAVDTALSGCAAPTPTPLLLPVCPSNTPAPTPTPTPTRTPCDGCTPTPTPTITLTPTNTFPP